MPDLTPIVDAGMRGFKTVHDSNEKRTFRRKMYTTINASETEDTKLEPIRVDTAALMDPAQFLQPVPREGEPKPAPKLQAPDQPTTIEPAPEQKRPTLARVRSAVDTMPGTDLLTNEIFGGALDFVSNTVDGIGALLGEDSQGRIRQLAMMVPEVEKSDSTMGQYVRGVVQFLTGMSTGLGVTSRAITGTGRAAAVARTAGADAIADFFSFKGNQPRLATIVHENLPDFVRTPHVESFLQFLEGDPGDSELDGRFRNVLEGQMLNQLGAAVLNPKQYVDDIYRTAKSVQNVNFLRKYLNNEVGAVGRPIQLSRAQQAATAADVQAMQTAKAQTNPSARYEQLKVAIRREGAASPDKIKRMVSDYHLPMEELQNMVASGARSAEEAAAFVQTMGEGLVELRRDAAKFLKSPGSNEALQRVLDRTKGLMEVDTLFYGAKGEAGRTLLASQSLDSILGEAGAGSFRHALESLRTQTPDDVRLFAEALFKTDVPAETVTRMGQNLKAGRPWGKALMEAYIGTRFTIGSVTRAVASNFSMMNSLIAERYWAAATTRAGLHAGSNITFQEANKFATGIYSHFGSVIRKYVDNTLHPEKMLREVHKLDSYDHVITSKNFDTGNATLNNVVDGLGQFFRLGPNQMGAIDVGFREMLEAGEFEALAYREAVSRARGLAEATDVPFHAMADTVDAHYQALTRAQPQFLKQKAEEFARYGTFTDPFKPDTAGGRAMLSVQDFYLAHPSTRLFATFFRTPVRIAQARLKRMPVLGRLLSDTQEAITSNHAERAALAGAKRAIGGIIGTTTAGLVSSGWVVMSGPADKRAKTLFRDAGLQENSVVISKYKNGMPREVIPFKSIQEPYGLVMSAMGNAFEMGKAFHQLNFNDELTPEQEEAYWEYMAGVGEFASRITEDQVFFSGFLQVLDAFRTGQANKIRTTLASYPLGPGAANFAKAFDPAKKELDSLADAFLERIPGGRSVLDNKVTLLGEDYIDGHGVYPDQVQPGVASYLISKAAPTWVTGDHDPQWQPIREFQNEHVDILPGLTPARNIGGHIDMTEKRAAMNRIRAGVDHVREDGTLIPAVRVGGKTLRERWLETVTSDAPEPVKIAAYNALYTAYTSAAGKFLQRVWPDIGEEHIRDMLRKDGLDPDQYLGGQ